MKGKYNVYHIFDTDGKLLQVEYALEAVNNSTPFIVTKNKDIIVCANKRLYSSKLMDEELMCIQKISNNVYMALTGYPADLNQVLANVKDICYSKELKLGIDVTPDILCRSFADKMQFLIQSTGERTFAFGSAFFGFDSNGPVLCATDTSSTFYFYNALAYGEKSGNITKYLEKNYNFNLNNDELIELTVQALLESIGSETLYNELDVYVMVKGEALRKLDDDEKEKILYSISDK